MTLLDVIFPKKCVNCGKFGGYLCRDCLAKVEFVEKAVCPVCSRQAIGGKTHPGCSNKYRLDGLVAGIKYRGAVRKGIGRIKYNWTFDIAEEFVDLLTQNIWRFDVPEEYVLVPIPLHPKRKNWRGFNQAQLICEILAKKFNVNWANMLVRNRETKTQVGLKRKEREVNIAGAFSVADSPKGNIILVDDVFTTGATMSEACRVLKRAGAARVWAMVLALD